MHTYKLEFQGHSVDALEERKSLSEVAGEKFPVPYLRVGTASKPEVLKEILLPG